MVYKIVHRVCDDDGCGGDRLITAITFVEGEQLLVTNGVFMVIGPCDKYVFATQVGSLEYAADTKITEEENKVTNEYMKKLPSKSKGKKNAKKY